MAKGGAKKTKPAASKQEPEQEPTNGVAEKAKGAAKPAKKPASRTRAKAEVPKPKGVTKKSKCKIPAGFEAKLMPIRP